LDGEPEREGERGVTIEHWDWAILHNTADRTKIMIPYSTRQIFMPVLSECKMFNNVTPTFTDP
jgi:hypothetical protein